jgi:excisionase family DNA binding protein
MALGGTDMRDKLTVREVADYLGISRTTVWKMISNGELPATKNPVDKRQHLVPLAAVEKLQADGRKKDTRRLSDRPRPRTAGMYTGAVKVHSDEIEDYLKEHWHPS